MCQEHVLSYKHPDKPLDKGRFVFECILAGPREPAFNLPRVVDFFHVRDIVDCILHLFGLTFFPGNSQFPVTK